MTRKRELEAIADELRVVHARWGEPRHRAQLEAEAGKLVLRSFDAGAFHDQHDIVFLTRDAARKSGPRAAFSMIVKLLARAANASVEDELDRGVLMLANQVDAYAAAAADDEIASAAGAPPQNQDLRASFEALSSAELTVTRMIHPQVHRTPQLRRGGFVTQAQVNRFVLLSNDAARLLTPPGKDRTDWWSALFDLVGELVTSTGPNHYQEEINNAAVASVEALRRIAETRAHQQPDSKHEPSLDAPPRQTRRLAQAIGQAIGQLGPFEEACHAFAEACGEFHHPSTDDAGQPLIPSEVRTSRYHAAIAVRNQARAEQLRLIQLASELTEGLESDLPMARRADDTVGKVRRLLDAFSGAVSSMNNPYECRSEALPAERNRFEQVLSGLGDVRHFLKTVGEPEHRRANGGSRQEADGPRSPDGQNPQAPLVHGAHKASRGDVAPTARRAAAKPNAPRKRNRPGRRRGKPTGHGVSPTIDAVPQVGIVLHVSAQQVTVAGAGKMNLRTPAEVAYLKCLIEAKGGWVRRDGWATSVGDRPDKVKKALPAAVRDLIKSACGPGGGVMLTVSGRVEE